MPIVAVADVAITTTGPASVVADNPLVYTITVTNTGPSDAADVEVTDGTPTGLVFVSNTGDCTTAFPCALGVVPVGATRTITATFTVPPGYSGPSPIEYLTIASSTKTLDPDDEQQQGDRPDDAESRCRRRGHQDPAVVQGVCR